MLKKKDIKVGLVVKSIPTKRGQDSGEAEVVSYDGSKRVVIKFLETGNIKEVLYSQFLKGLNFDNKRFVKEKEPTKCLFRFTDKVYETWDTYCGIEGAVRMPVFGSSTKTINNFDTVVGETLVDSWFYDKYKGIVLGAGNNGYIIISSDKRNIERFFKVKSKKYHRFKKHFRLHHFIRGHSNGGGLFVDHINNIKSDNRFCNLRTATMEENARNSVKSSTVTSSKYKGVYLKKKQLLSKKGKPLKAWRAILSKGGKSYLTYHYSEIEAAIGYNELAIKHFGEFANLNVINEE